MAAFVTIQPLVTLLTVAVLAVDGSLFTNLWKMVATPDHRECPLNLASCHDDHSGYSAFEALMSEVDSDRNGRVTLEEGFRVLGATPAAMDVLTDKRDMTSILGVSDNVTLSAAWIRWSSSKQYKWTSRQLADWLELELNSDVYTRPIMKKKLDGKSISKFSETNGTFLKKALGIINEEIVHYVRDISKSLIFFGELAEHGNRYFKVDSLMTTSLVFVVLSLLVFVMYSETESEVTKAKRRGGGGGEGDVVCGAKHVRELKEIMENIVSCFEDIYEECANGTNFVRVNDIINKIIESYPNIDQESIEKEFTQSLSHLSPCLTTDSYISPAISRMLISSMIHKHQNNNYENGIRPDSCMDFSSDTDNNLQEENLKLKESIRNLENEISDLKNINDFEQLHNVDISEKLEFIKKDNHEINCELRKQITVLSTTNLEVSAVNDSLAEDIKHSENKFKEQKKNHANVLSEYEHIEETTSTMLQNEIDKNMELESYVYKLNQTIEDGCKITNESILEDDNDDVDNVDEVDRGGSDEDRNTIEKLETELSQLRLCFSDLKSSVDRDRIELNMSIHNMSNAEVKPISPNTIKRSIFTELINADEGNEYLQTPICGTTNIQPLRCRNLAKTSLFAESQIESSTIEKRSILSITNICSMFGFTLSTVFVLFVIGWLIFIRYKRIVLNFGLEFVNGPPPS